jgi:hypothetical protein
MAQDWVIHGVPMALERDGWWLDDPHQPSAQARLAHTGKRPLWALLLLIGLADVLFYRQTPGLSLALFAVAVFAATMTGRPRPVALVVLVLSVLPVVDYVQALSVVILLLGLPLAIVLNRAAPALPATWALLLSVPLRGTRDGIHALRHFRTNLHPTSTAKRLLTNWAFPVGGTLVLVSLLTEANPILGEWIAVLTNLPLNPVEALIRASFWIGIALLIWPLLATAPVPAGRTAKSLPHINLGLNATSVSNALIAFNLILGLQTLLDARYLWTGAELPQGMTLATYAHRGAYPLLATALLAGAFALAARPWLAERKSLKPLLILWLAQNTLLTLSALYRLDLYVQAFGLSYLRIYAAIWMGLVATGLALTLTQIATARTNHWLLTRCTLLAAATLYLAAFVNFADLIAKVNVAEDHIDAVYLCSLGPTAAAALPAAICPQIHPETPGWRDWGYRNWRVLRYLEPQEAPYENPRRG